MLVLVGLGNPEKTYENTYHNLGFQALDTLAELLNKKPKKAECSSLTAVFSKAGENIVLAKPLTYMNLSGEAVKSLLKKYKASPEELVIVYDDFDIPRFSLRARVSGSAGTHNGMRNIVEALGTTEFKRIRIGIGNEEREKREYVLSEISKADKETYQAVLNNLASALKEYIEKRDFDALMRKING